MSRFIDWLISGDRPFWIGLAAAGVILMVRIIRNA